MSYSVWVVMGGFGCADVAWVLGGGCSGVWVCDLGFPLILGLPFDLGSFDLC